MALFTGGRNQATISPVGGGWTYFQPCDNTGTPTSPGAWVIGPYWKEFKWKDSQPFVKYKCDDATVLVSVAEREVDFTGVTYQRQVENWKAAIEASNSITNGPSFFNVLRQASKSKINGVYQYILYACCQFEPVVEVNQLGNETMYHCWINPIPASVTYSAFTGCTGTASSFFPTGASITVDVTTNPYYAFYQPVS